MRQEIHQYMQAAAGSAFLLLLVCIPSSLSTLPDLGALIGNGLEPLLHRLGPALYPSCDSCIWSISSDTHGLGLMVLISLGFGLCSLLFWTWISARKREQAIKYLKVILLLYLSTQLARYGMHKVLMAQFTTPEANILYTPLGLLDKDILYWSTMGVSRPYNIFLGSLELVAAALLLWFRTRTVGLLMSSMILLHVFVIDLSYGIDVRIFSGFLLSISSFLVLPEFLAILMSSSRSSIQLPLRPILTRSLWLYRLRPFVYALMAFEVLAPTLIYSDNPDYRAPGISEYVGAYAVTSDSPEAPQRFFIHSHGYLISQGTDLQLNDYPMHLDTSTRTVHIPQERGVLCFSNFDDQGRLSISGQFEGRAIDWSVRKLNLESLPVHAAPSFFVKGKK